MKANVTKRSKISAIIFNIFITTGACAFPEKPVIRFCSVDYPRLEATCKLAGGAGDSIRSPLEILDRGICFVPKDWELVQNYLHLLEEFSKRSCDQNP